MADCVQYKLVHPEFGEFCRTHQDDSEDPVVGKDLEGLLNQVAEVCNYGSSIENLVNEFDGGELTGYAPVRVVTCAATEDDLRKFSKLVGLTDR